MGLVGPVVAQSTEDQEVPGSNPPLAYHEFLCAQEMNLRSSTQPRNELVPWEGSLCLCKFDISWLY